MVEKILQKLFCPWAVDVDDMICAELQVQFSRANYFDRSNGSQIQ